MSVDIKTQWERYQGLMFLASQFFRANPENQHKIMNISNAEVLELFANLEKHQVKFMLVGGMASVVHGHIRTTQDLDLWVKNEVENHENLIAALLDSEVRGAEHLRNTPLLFGWTSVSIGKYGSFQIDLGNELKSKLDFDACYENALNANYDGTSFKVIHLNDLITEKKSTGRYKDLADVEELEKIKQQKQ